MPQNYNFQRNEKQFFLVIKTTLKHGKPETAPAVAIDMGILPRSEEKKWIL